MSTAVDLLLSLADQGVNIRFENGVVRIRSPKGSASAEHLRALREVSRADVEKAIIDLQLPEDAPIEPRDTSVQAIPLTGTQRTPWNYPPPGNAQLRNSPISLRILGHLDIQLLKDSLDALTRRHDALRTRIVVNGEPKQYVLSAANRPRLEIVNLASYDNRHKDARSKAAVQEFIDQAINYTLDPLFSVLIVRVANDQHILILGLAHIITDGMSNRVLDRDLWALYEQRAKESGPALPPIQLHFPDYANWLDKLYPTWCSTHGRYWTKHLAEAPSVNWPPPNLSIPGGGFQFRSISIPFGITLTADLYKVAAKEEVLPSIVVLTLFVIGLSNWCKQTDITIATVDSGRYRSELTQMVGCLASHLHLRLVLDKGQTFSELIYLVNQEFADASSHRDFDWVPTLFPGLKCELLFNWFPIVGGQGVRKVGDLRGTYDGLEIAPFPFSFGKVEDRNPEQASPFKLILTCFGDATDLKLVVLYRSDFLSETPVERFGEDLRRIITALLETPHLPWDLHA